MSAVILVPHKVNGSFNPCAVRVNTHFRGTISRSVSNYSSHTVKDSKLLLQSDFSYGLGVAGCDGRLSRTSSASGRELEDDGPHMMRHNPTLPLEVTSDKHSLQMVFVPKFSMLNKDVGYMTEGLRETNFKDDRFL
ncbi:hypothetical protein TeGR_g1770 [Tetraparma gracilis]|uniref:Uncharacterized protein n=1 Tax=Tetraparma gracilis TaxID=2962635 RepID=A0ABQ6N6M8_9STRA|nr:hypothetical protein TeGR_g1770 [Tetraparma gracilis]